MSTRSHTPVTLAAGEVLLWQGRPRPGLPTAPGSKRLGVVLIGATLVLFLTAGWIEVFHARILPTRLLVYLMIVLAAFCSYLALRQLVLNRRRDRAHDARTAYAITSRRAVVLSGPYRTELPLGPDVEARKSGDSIALLGSGPTLWFERLDDADMVRDILVARTGGTP